ncbi:MAG: hypothetical protein ACR2IL_04390 [Chitinophagaceae bacterium]
MLQLNFMNPTHHLPKQTLELTALLFNEDGINYLYIPALDAMSYGLTAEEARAGMKPILNEFIRYTQEQNTLAPLLKTFGWQLESQTAPNWSFLLAHNDQLNDIVNNQAYTTETYPFQFPNLR